MKKLLLSLVMVIASDAILVPQLVQAANTSGFYPPKKKVRSSVTGSGKTKSEAENEAQRNARAISSSYSTIRKNTSGSKDSWTCTMVIEYEEK